MLYATEMKGRMPKNLFLLHNLIRSDEWKIKIGLGHKGMKHTEETKRKISDTKRHPLTPLYKAIRRCYKSKQWRKNIFKRDNYTCQLCKKRGNELNADHFPKRFVDIVRNSKINTIEEAFSLKELWDINNGRTLCYKCHSKTETFGNKFKK